MEVEIISKTHYLKELKSSTNFDPNSLDYTIRRIAEQEGFLEYKIDKQCIVTNGGNYLGTLYEFNVNGKTKNGNKELNLFVKYTIHLESLKVFEVSDVYNNEAFVYNELSKVFAGLQEEANVPKEERFKLVKAYEGTNTKAIIMENIVKRGFTTYNRLDPMSLKFTQRAIQELAKFHALSFAIKDKRPEYFDRVIKRMKTLLIFGDDWRAMVDKTCMSVIDYIDENYKDKIEKAYKGLATKYDEYYSDDTVKVCLCHGDFRPNNIMVKFNEDEIQEMIPVDYQFTYYGCPVYDFLYLIYIGTDRELRNAHLSDLKDLYYDTLTNFLKYFDIDANMVYPRREFEKVYNDKLYMGLMTALLVLPLVLASDTHAPDLSKDTSDLVYEVHDRFKDRIHGVIEDYVEWGYI